MFNFANRLRVTWVGPDCSHSPCSCSLLVEILDPMFSGQQYFVDRKCHTATRSDREMYYVALALIASSWKMERGIIRAISSSQFETLASLYIDSARANNQQIIPALFRHTSIPKAMDPVFPHPKVVLAYRDWDMYYFNHLLGMDVKANEVVNHVWKQSQFCHGLPWSPTYVPTLKALCLRNLSAYNIAFTGGPFGKYAVGALEELYPDKITAAYAKLGTRTRNINSAGRATFPHWARALQLMYDFMRMTDEMGRYKLEFGTPLSEIPPDSSSGDRSGMTTKFPATADRPYAVRISVRGKKLEQRSYAVKELETMIAMAQRGISHQMNDIAWTYCAKQEMYSMFGKDTQQAYAKGRLKFRNYVINSLTGYGLEKLILSLRQSIERGWMIKIGMKWWHGGAWELFKQMCCDHPDIEYSDGDVENFDLSVNMILIQLYMSQAGIYFMPGKNTAAYKILLRNAIHYISQRVSHIFGDIWRVVYGHMPSGSYATSHGDSWIMGFLYFLFVACTWAATPSRRNEIDREFLRRRWGIIVYGDDHNIWNPKSLRILNEAHFAKWLLRCFDMKCRDIRTDLRIVSEMSATGHMLTKGLVFLQRYFIRRPRHFPDDEFQPPIYPYRPTLKYYTKIPYGSGQVRDDIDVALSCCGNAWDTMGTNLHAYKFCLYVYLQMIKGKDTASVRAQMLARFASNKEKDAMKLVRKCDISIIQMCSGFPSMSELITKHRVDSEYVRFVKNDHGYERV